ncbi:MAG: hypothetical protein ACRD1C_11485 [Terriglobales bacterium]
MTSVPGPARQDPIAHLRLERRSYIIGTLIVWGVIVATIIILIASMEPKMFAAPRATTFQVAMQRARELPPLTAQQQLLLEIINVVGGVALFFLNWRFSLLLRRPRWAFAKPGGARPLFAAPWRRSARPPASVAAPDTARPAPTAGGRLPNELAMPPVRWLWWSILFFVSLFYIVLYLLPQLILTVVLAHLATVEIRLRQSPLPAPPA